MSRLAFLFSVLVACGGDATTGPTIPNITYTPETVTAGVVPSSVDVTLDFDTKSDLTQIEFTLVSGPSGPTTTPQAFPVANAAGIHNGTLDAKLSLTFSSKGAYTFALDVIDSGGHASNQLQGTITAQ